MELLRELRQRKVFRVAVAYGIVAWLLVQVADTVLPALQLPPWTVTFTTVLLLLGFPVALLLGWSFDVVRAPPSPAGDRSTQQDEPPVAGNAVPARGGLVVLPFANMSDEASFTHFADGLVEDLTTRLQAEGLRVASRQSAFAYRDRAADARTIARELGCAYVLEGSVRKIGDRVRLTAQLIDARNDEHLWAERFDRRIENAFELQDEVCEPIVAAVVARLNPPLPTAEAIPPQSLAGLQPAPLLDNTATGRSRKIANRLLGPGMLLGVAAVVVALAATLTTTLQGRSQERWAREQALPELEALITQGKRVEAFELGQRIAQVIPNDPRLKALEPEFAASIELDTTPTGARVSYRPFTSDDTAWRDLGMSPLRDVPVPLGFGLWKFEAEGRATTLRALRNPGMQLGNERDQTVLAINKAATAIELPAQADVPAGMVSIPLTHNPIMLVAEQSIELPAYHLDRLETSNREYQEFVAAGGYSDDAYWRDLPFAPERGGWPLQVKAFVDSTGRPGPATWEAGTYPDGTADHPVGGLSWFEAAAYARFRGKELPTAYHWYRAATSALEVYESLGTAVIQLSNFAENGPWPVGKSRGYSTYGTQDMAGNVREWLWTATDSRRWVAGGSWKGPGYMYLNRDAAEPYDRSPENGVRLMRAAGIPAAGSKLRDPVHFKVDDYSAMQPASDAVYAAIAERYAYRNPSSLVADVVAIKSTNPAWRHERIRLPTGYDSGTFDVQLFLPADARGPVPIVVFGPHSGFRMGLTPSVEFDPTAHAIPLDFILKSGRALAIVSFDSFFERSWSPSHSATMTWPERHRLLLTHWRAELGRTLDYLGTRNDVDADRVAWWGASYGSSVMLPLLALEPRVRVNVLYTGGVMLTNLPPAEDLFNYFPRIRQPTLMLNGRWDTVFSQQSQAALYQLLGTPAEQKRHVVYDGGHAVQPRRDVVRETLDWFDRYL
jgi:TolB-like protein/formylglycine-generating enzyme required for sulfatase activity